MRRKVYEVLEPGQQSQSWEKWVDLSVIALILISVANVFLQTMPEMAAHQAVLEEMERWIVVVFSVEYLLRLWTAPEAGLYGTGWRAYFRYALTPAALIDLAAVLPYYLAPMAQANSMVLRLLRIFRLVRVLKIGRYHTSMSLLVRVLKLRREELTVSLGLVLALVMIASTLMYAVEHDAQPKAFPSIPAAIWWGVVTMTTVGYGDVYPITSAGKFVAGVSVLLGVGLFALPAGILASGFHEELARQKANEDCVCPHCGKQIDR
jgi:voltage-gated potassium channel